MIGQPVGGRPQSAGELKIVDIGMRQGSTVLRSWEVALVVSAVLLGCSAHCRAAPAAGLRTLSLEQLADRLTSLTEKELASAFCSGRWALNVCDTPSPGGGRVQAHAPENALTELVARGPRAIPFLCRHVFDKRPVRYVASGFANEVRGVYDRNPWGHGAGPSRSTPPAVDQHARFLQTSQATGPVGGWQLTVGDLCYFALGQIVNREFLPVDYSGSNGPMVVDAPSRYTDLGAEAHREWVGVDRRRLVASLRDDVLRPDRNGRDVGAIRRLRLYSPESVEAAVLAKLRLPIRWVNDDLYTARYWHYRRPNHVDFDELIYVVLAIWDIASEKIDMRLSGILQQAVQHPRLRANDLLVLALSKRLSSRSSHDRALARLYFERRLAMPDRFPRSLYPLVAALHAIDQLEYAHIYNPTRSH